MQGPALYAVGTRVDTSERGATNSKGDQQAPLGMHQRDQGQDTHRTITGQQGMVDGQQKRADRGLTEADYRDKNRVSEYGGGEQAATCMVGGVSEEGGGYYFCGGMLHTKEGAWDDQHDGI